MTSTSPEIAGRRLARVLTATIRVGAVLAASASTVSCFAQTTPGDEKSTLTPATKQKAWLPIPADDEQPTEEAARDDTTPPIDWKLLAFSWYEKPEPRRVVRVRLVLYKYTNAGFGGDERVKPHAFDKEFSDARTVGLVQLGLTRALRRAYSDGAAAGNSPVGQLQVMTNRDVFRIAIQEQGFGLSGEYVDHDNEFFSPVLANLVQDIAKSAKLELVNSIQFKRAFEGMSGEHWRRATEINLKELMQRVEKQAK